jgi:hypothetical protein
LASIEVRMPSNGRPSINKRNREQARRERVRAKEERRIERANERKERPETPSGEDPDIAGIKPGPQRPLED